MKAPPWFWIGSVIWLVLGLPALLLGSMWNGGFDPIIDPPPFFQAPYEDRSIAANMTWLFAATLVYLPLILVPALLISRWRNRKSD
ncbi:MAG: hypothetical protein AB7E24_23700 [Novosphingobium sp.]